MHKLIIHNLGPIEQCELECSQFITLTGFQASGKSTVAKAIYFFRTIKDDIIELLKARRINNISVNGMNADLGVSLKKDLENHLREKFLRTFGSSWGMLNDMYMVYQFTPICSIKVSLKPDTKYATPNYIWLTFSDGLNQFLKEKNNCFINSELGILKEELEKNTTELYQFFDDFYSVVYIPAGRSMITLLSQQFAYIYAMMDDMQKRSLDSCTKDYLERILRLKPEFSEGLEGVIATFAGKTALPHKLVLQVMDLINHVLRGAYRYRNGEEQIVLDHGKYVKINFASSGQQESVWILNLLFYYLLQNRQILFIIEEPESHLFPESQKYITELISLVVNCGHSVVLTTHSSYVLGTLNNLLYAFTLPFENKKTVDEIIPESLWVNYHNFGSWFVKNGIIENCMDAEIHMIQNEKIDEISKVINDDFEQLLDLQNEESVVS